MSRSAIDCRACHHTLAHKHHTGRIKVMAGIPVTILPDGRVQLECPCGCTRVLVTGIPSTRAA